MCCLTQVVVLPYLTTLTLYLMKMEMERKKEKKKINAFSILAAGVHITRDSSLRVSKVLFYYFLNQFTKERNSRGLGTEIWKATWAQVKFIIAFLLQLYFGSTA